MFKETTTKIPCNIDAKILLFSDIHYTGIKDRKKIEKLINKANTYEVDYICITGDMLETYIINNEIDSNYFIDFLTRLTNISKVVISLGNHDTIDRDKRKIYKKDFWNKVAAINNLYFLNNNGMLVDNIYFYGFTQSKDYYYKYKSENAKLMLRDIDNNGVVNNLPNNYRILLMHSPIRLDNNDVKTKLDKYDLILSGHMHNGLVLPIIDEIIPNDIGFIAPNKTLFPKYSRGMVKENNIVVISGAVTKLSSELNIIFRLLNNLFPISLDYIHLSSKIKKIEKNIKYCK